MDKLKPCPFCGGEAVFVTRSVGYGRRCATFNFEISCKTCSAEAPEAYGSIEINFDQNGEVAMYKDERSKAIDMAIFALEKQIPKKLIAEGDGYADGSMVYDSFYCPSCDHRLEEDEVEDYCPNCGQKIC